MSDFDGDVAFILSGAGHRDGSEIAESVLAAAAAARLGLRPVWFAPDVQQEAVLDHLTATATSEHRNAMQEAARIARGKIQPLTALDVRAVVAVVIPGGCGNVRTLSNFRAAGAECWVRDDVSCAFDEVIRYGKPILAIGMAIPLIVLLLLRRGRVPHVTFGPREDVAGRFGGAVRVSPAGPENAIADRASRLVTTPAYLWREAALDHVQQGIDTGMNLLSSWILERAA